MEIQLNPELRYRQRTGTGILQARLADALALTVRAKQVRWNLDESKFSRMRKLLAAVQKDASTSSEAISRRIVNLGGQAYGSAVMDATTSSLKKSCQAINNEDDLIEEFASEMLDFGIALRDASSEARKIGDLVSSELFIVILKNLEKSLILVEAQRS